MSRPQVSIDRITPRPATVESKESMNCKSCRKRKIKCNRMRPSCEACKIFQCACIYDAVPKKRGPKTDVLEALLKRVDGLEKRLLLEKSSNAVKLGNVDNSDEQAISSESSVGPAVSALDSSSSAPDQGNSISSTTAQQTDQLSTRSDEYASLPSFTQQQSSQGQLLPDGVLDAYFSRLHGKPFYVLDESKIRQNYRLGQLPKCLSMAIYAVTHRYTSPAGTPEHSLRMGLDLALQARRLVDIDDPSIEGLQTLLLLSQAFFAYGLGKKAYMTFSNCAAMVVALDLYRELPTTVDYSSTEREMRRRLFWSAYIMDRFITCGSKRPCLISDNSVRLRLPSWSPRGTNLNVEGEVFNVGPNIQFSSDSRRRGQGAAALLIDITRILGVANRYLAAGGVRGDSHFPWHSLSNLSKIRQELDIWAAGTQDVFASIDALFGHPENTNLLLSKLIYHLVHCLIYRPFLPIDLVELRGTGEHQSWQIEATNLCFSHSNAIAELVELGRATRVIEWPAFVGYCVCTAGTVHVHGVHYKGREGEVFSSSSDFLTREMHQLSWLRSYWAGVQHQRELLQTIYACHSELVRALSTSSMRFSPVFHLEDFLDRYPGLSVDGAHVRLVDMTRFSNESASVHFTDRRDMYFGAAVTTAPSYSSQTSTYQPPARTHQLSTPNLSQPSKHDRRGSRHIPNPSPLSPYFNFTQLNPQQSEPRIPSGFPIGNTELPVPNALSNDQSTLPPNPFSPPSFGFTPPAFLAEGALTEAPTPPPNPQYATFPFDTTSMNNRGAATDGSMLIGSTALTPGAQSQGSHGGTASDSGSTAEIDPFLSLLEQLAENEQNSQGGPSELDFFLAAGAIDPADQGDQKSLVGGLGLAHVDQVPPPPPRPPSAGGN